MSFEIGGFGRIFRGYSKRLGNDVYDSVGLRGEMILVRSRGGSFDGVYIVLGRNFRE